MLPSISTMSFKPRAEVNDVAADDDLPAKGNAELLRADGLPQALLRRSEVRAHLLSALQKDEVIVRTDGR